MKSAKQILDKVRYCTIATVSNDGQPWNTPVFYVYDEDMNIYWWSSQKSVHSQNIANNSKIFIVVYDSTVREGEGLGVYIRATARILEQQDETDKAIDMYNQFANVYKIDKKVVSGEAPTRLYTASPENIWMNAESEENGYYIDTRKEISL